MSDVEEPKDEVLSDEFSELRSPAVDIPPTQFEERSVALSGVKPEESRFRAVAGKTPGTRELAEWDEGHFYTFLKFCDLFITDEGEGEARKVRLSVTKKRWFEVEEYLKEPDHPYNEFLYRINFFSFSKDATEKRFFLKLIRIMQAVLGYLKKNPSLVTARLRNIIEPNPKYNWCIVQTRVYQTPVGAVVAPSKYSLIPNQGVEPVYYESKLNDAMFKAADLVSKLVDSITEKDIKKLKPKERLMIFSRLSFVFSLSKNMRPVRQIFKQLNINTADRDSLEAAMLEFNREE